MVITGTRFRTIYPQDTVNWTASINAQNTSGAFSLSFSGSAGLSNALTLNNGKIYSPNSDLIGSYLNNEIINFSGNIGQRTLDLYKNNTPLYLGLPRPATGQLTSVVLRDITGQCADLSNLTILGKTPGTSYNPFLIFYAGETVPFSIYNSGSSPFTIFSGSTTNTNFTLSGINNLVVPANNSGTFFIVSSLTGTTAIQDIPISIYSTIGQRDLYVQLSGTLITDDLFYLSFGPDNSPVYNGEYNLYNLSLRNPSGVNLSIALNYVSGITGNYYRAVQSTGFQSSGLVSGFISGVGTLSSQITGRISGFNNLNSQFEYGTGTGIGSLYRISDNKLVSGAYSAFSTGIGNIGLTADIQATGYSNNFNYSGYISYLGGNVTGTNITGNVSGIIFNQVVTGTTNSGNFIGFVPYTGKITGNFTSGELDTINLTSAQRFVTGNFTNIISLVGYGFATGERISGKLLGDFGVAYEPGTYVFSKPYVGIGSGSSDLPSEFNPVLDIFNSLAPTTGLISGTVSVERVFEGCSEIDLDFDLVATGIPMSIGKIGETGSYTPIAKFYTLPLNSGEFAYENSTGISGFGYKRTTISSGSGIYDNIFQVPFFTGGSILNASGQEVSGYGRDFIGWKQTISTTQKTGFQETTGTQYMNYMSGKYNLFDDDDYTSFNLRITGLDYARYLLGFRFASKTTGEMLYTDLYKINYFNQETGYFVSGGLYSGMYASGVSGLFTGTTGVFYNSSMLYKQAPSEIAIVTGIGNVFYEKTRTGMWSGGYYINYNNKLIGQTGGLVVSNQFPTGNYSLEIRSKNIIPSGVNSDIYLSHGSYTGCEKDLYIAFQLNRTGYANYIQSGKLVAKFENTNNNLPYMSDENILSGFIFNYAFNYGETGKSFAIPVYPNNKFEKLSNGTVSLQADTNYQIVNLFEFPVVNYSRTSAEFVLFDDETIDTCTKTVTPSSNVIYPYNNSSLDFKALPTPTPAPTSTPPPTPPPTPTPSPSPSPTPTPTPPVTPEDPNNPNDPDNPEDPNEPPVFPPLPPVERDCDRQLPEPDATGYPRNPGTNCFNHPLSPQTPYCCETTNVCGQQAVVSVSLKGGDPEEWYRIAVFYNGRQIGQSALIRANQKISDIDNSIYISDDYFKPSTKTPVQVRVWGGNFAVRHGERPSQGCTVNNLNQDGTIPMYSEKTFYLEGYPQGQNFPLIGCLPACNQCS
jgi:hypothetical protein